MVTRLPLTHDRILKVALTLADEHGLSALSMRKLAAELGYEAMSLYNHVPNKDAVIDGIIDLVAAEIDLPAPGTPWKEAVRGTALSAHRALMTHPWACQRWSSVQVGPARLAYMDALIRSFLEGGLPMPLADRGFHAVSNHVVGFSLQELSYRMSEEEMQEAAAGFLEALDHETYPHLAEHIQHHLDGSAPMDGFEFGLDLILDGLERATVR